MTEEVLLRWKMAYQELTESCYIHPVNLASVLSKGDIVYDDKISRELAIRLKKKFGPFTRVREELGL